MKFHILPFLLFLLISPVLTAQNVIVKKGLYLHKETGKPYSGIYKEFDAEGRLVSETSIKDGLLDGNTFIYNPSGTKKEMRGYKAGLKNGTWAVWNEKGVKTAEASFAAGKKDGFWYVWDDEATKRYEMFYQNGEKKGTWIQWDENGVEISRETFK
jgi:antitoxin component YwqK of YwqJK toxin-antitoxin module